MRKILLSLVSLALCATPCFAGPQVGTLTNVEGSVQIYSHPSEDGVQGPPPHAKFEGMYYSVQEAKIGDRVENGNIVRTRPGAKTRIIFDNGDQFYVAPATSFRVHWDKDTADGNPELELRYGKSRFVIEKGGPRTRFRIHSPTAVMGVRGTDFFVAVDGSTGETETATLRGSVEVRSEATPQTEYVTAGQTGSVGRAALELHKTTQDELKSISRNSELKPPQPEQTPAPDVAQKVQELEAVAAKTTLKDIGKDDPALAEKLEPSHGTVASLNAAVVAQLAEQASAEHHIGPIADVSLEKGEKQAEAVPAPAVKLPEHKLWIGLRIAGGGSSFDVGGASQVINQGMGPCGGVNQPSCTAPIFSDGSKGVTLLAIQADWAFSERFSLLGEFLPIANAGASGNFGMSQCMGNCGNEFGRIDTKSLRLNAMVHWNLPLFGTQRFGFDAYAGPGINELTDATFPYNSEQDITSSFRSLSLLFNLGVGLHERIFDNFKLAADFRIMKGLTDMESSSGIFTDGTTIKLSEKSVGIALLYGF